MSTSERLLNVARDGWDSGSPQGVPMCLTAFRNVASLSLARAGVFLMAWAV